jgi:RNA polymerase-interacting CarD/CdnL/TRCF family regulator
MEGLDKLKSGDFNSMNQEPQPDGSVIITLSKRREGKTYRFRVRNLYKENQEVLEHEIIEAKPLKERHG